MRSWESTSKSRPSGRRPPGSARPSWPSSWLGRAPGRPSCTAAAGRRSARTPARTAVRTGRAASLGWRAARLAHRGRRSMSSSLSVHGARRSSARHAEAGAETGRIAIPRGRCYPSVTNDGRAARSHGARGVRPYDAWCRPPPPFAPSPRALGRKLRRTGPGRRPGPVGAADPDPRSGAPYGRRHAADLTVPIGRRQAGAGHGCGVGHGPGDCAPVRRRGSTGRGGRPRRRRVLAVVDEIRDVHGRGRGLRLRRRRGRPSTRCTAWSPPSSTGSVASTC